MSAAEFTTQPIDRRRMDQQDRDDYDPSKRMEAISRVKEYRAYNNYEQNRPKSTTVHRPGSGGQKPGAYAQANRQSEKKYEDRRAESMRPETATEDPVAQVYRPTVENGRVRPPVNADNLKAEAKNKYM